MKKTILLFALLAFALPSIAQDTSKFYYKVWHYYAQLNTADQSTSVLYDRVVPFSNIYRFNGIYDTFTTRNHWLQMYLELKLAAYDTNELAPVLTMLAPAENLGFRDTITLGVLNYTYDKLKLDAVDSNLLTYDTVNMQYLDVNNRTQSPYMQLYAFAAVPLFDQFVEDYSYKFHINSEYIFNNTGYALTNMRIDFGDGQGWRNVSAGQYVTITYPDSGTFNILFEAQSNGITRTSKTQIKLSKKDEPGDFVHPIYSDPYSYIPPVLYNNEKIYAAGKVTRRSPIDPITGEPRTCVKKPLIILDGIDFGPKGCGPLRCGNLGWHDLNHPDLDPKKGYPELEKMPQFLDQLIQDDYDIFFLDNENGSDYIQRNAMLVVKLIEMINSPAGQYNPHGKCGCEEIVILGPSMGGIVAKYALSYMEKNNMHHSVRLYVSLDAPHKGANLPLGSQHMLEYFKDAGVYDAVQNYENKVISNAACQLLQFHVKGYDLAGNPGHNSFRTHFLNDLQSLGNYPSIPRRIAVINGSKTANFQASTKGRPHFIEGDLMLNYLWNGVIGPWACQGIPILNLFPARPEAYFWSMPGTWFSPTSNVIFLGDLPLEQSRRVTVPINSPAPDHMPGSSSNALEVLDKQMYAYCGWMTFKVGYMKLEQKIFNFIPSISGLDVNTSATDYLYNISTNIPNTDLADRQKYAFDAFYAPVNNNEKHIQITDANMAWLQAQFAVNKNILEPNLPTVVSPIKNTYNFGSTRKTLHSVNINSSGKIQVNGAYATDYGAPSANAISGSTFEVRTAMCSTIVNVANSGELVVGDNNGIAPNNNKGILTFTAGSNLNLNGGKLIIHDGSKLIIEKGATLTFNAGAQIELLGTNSILEIRGTLNIGNNATFSIYNHNATSGFVRFYNEYDQYNNWRNITAGTNSQFSLSSTLYSNKILEVTGGEYIYPEDHLQLFKIEMAQVELGDNCRLNIGCPLYLNNVHVYSINNVSIGTNGYTGHRGLHIYGQTDGFPNFQSTVTITNTEFKNGKYGIFAPLVVGVKGPVLNNSKFTGCDIGVYTDGRFINIENCTFTDCITGGWQGVSHIGTSIFNENKIHRTAQTISGDYGIYYTNSTSGTNTLNVQQSYIRDYGVGLATSNGNLKLECSKVKYNTKGISASGCELDLNGPNNNNGNNDVSANGTSIYMLNTSRLTIDNGGNNLAPATSGKCIDGILDCTAPTSIDGSNNWWSSTGTMPAGANTLVKMACTYPFAQSSINVSSNAMGLAFYQSCYSGPSRPVVIKDDMIMQMSAKDSALEKVSHVLDSAKSAMDLGEYANGIGFMHKGVKQIIKDKKPNKEAIIEIYDGILNTLNFAITNEIIRPYQKDENIIFDSVANLQSTIAAFIKDEDNTLRYKVTLDKAGLYVATNRQKEALKIFADMSGWAATSRLDEINFFSCLAAAEDSILSGVTLREEFERLIKPCTNYKHSNYTSQISNPDFNTFIESEKQISEETERIELYPNPAQHTINIKFHSINSPAKELIIELYDVTGKRVQFSKANNINTQGGIYTLILNELSPGMYMVNLQTENKNYKQKFIISR